MKVNAGSINVSTYFALRLTAGGDATGLTITDIDLQYTRSGQAPAAKVDATALAAPNTAHTDNQAIEVDTTDQPGLYRVDWPDAAFAVGVREVILTVKCASVNTEHLRVEIDGGVAYQYVDAHKPNFDISGPTQTVKNPDGSTAYTKTLTGADPATTDVITGSN